MAASGWPHAYADTPGGSRTPTRIGQKGRWSISIFPFFMRENLLLLPYIQPLRTRMIERMTQTIAVPPQMMPKPCGTLASGIQLVRVAINRTIAADLRKRAHRAASGKMYWCSTLTFP